MNAETKTVSKDLEDYLKFGWQHTEDTYERTGRFSYKKHVLVRDKSMPNYRLIVALEQKYFNLKSQMKTYKPVDFGWCLVAFLLFVVPGVIYLIVKNNQKNNVEMHNFTLEKQMNEVLAEVKPLLS